MDNLPSTEVNMQVVQCYTCKGWQPPRFMHSVVFNEIAEQVCPACYRKLKNRERDLDAEVQKEKEDEEAAKAFGNPPGQTH